MEKISIERELQSNAYPGRGIIVGRSADGKNAVIAYFIINMYAYACPIFFHYSSTIFLTSS